MDLSYLHVLDPVKGALGQAVIMLITAIYQNVVQFGDQDMYPKDYAQTLLKLPASPTYDFVIIGASTSGCILTNRLSESADFNILLLEAGGYPSATSDVPFLFSTLENSEEDWSFLTTKENYACKGFVDSRCILSRGKVLGGTTTINNMHYHRGSAFDYDRWDLDEWKSSTVSKYFANLEKYVGKTATPFDVGTKGNLTLSYFKSDHFLRLPLSKMYKTAGYKPLTRGKSLGYRDMLVSSWKSIRLNMARVFLGPIKQRTNFHMALGTTATRIVFTGDKRVAGVEIMIGKFKKFVRVRKEVILTAGPINNVKLLHMSGVGPKEILENNHIPVIADLPVGKNLQVHLRVPIFVAIDKCCGQCLNCSTPDCQNDFFDYHEFYQNTWDYVMDRIGFFTNTGINDFVAYISTNQRRRDAPNIAVFHTYFKRNDFYLKQFLKNRRFHPAVIASVLKYNKVRNIMLFYPTLISPVSRGEVYINSTYYQAQPVIKPNFLTDENGIDFRSMYAAVTMIVSLTDSLAMQRYKAKFLNIDIPNCRNFKFCSEYYFRCLMVNLGRPTRKLGGVTKMGHRCHNSTVTDQEQKVLHVRGLRVADVSISPTIGRSNGMSSDALFGEKLADVLRHRWDPHYLSMYRKKKSAINVVLESS
ncbi:glucose dehydrogenase [FAD, quinone]-like isoform X1 [Coccinella septempunctata]|uniref:glucose dehydrogenase [FAD, quinone]-like isoform X1 n=1 Tax=Coccinella septempunctata TaxID=41139 RepID=UPI001D08BF5C|nr:glucose dehydrogenase [FAD, quinone]-like isoform X1 [Coccinella septempunctata]